MEVGVRDGSYYMLRVSLCGAECGEIQTSFLFLSPGRPAEYKITGAAADRSRWVSHFLIFISAHFSGLCNESKLVQNF